MQAAQVPTLECPQPGALLWQLRGLGKRVAAEYRRQGYRYDQAGENRCDVGDAERREQAPLHPFQREQRQEGKNDQQCRVKNAGAHFHRSVGHHLERRARRRQGGVVAQAADHVLHAHHRIVHQLADGNGQAAQGHGVDRLPEQGQHQDGGGHAQRDRRQRDQGGTAPGDEQQQAQGDDARPVQQRLAHIAHRFLDEVGLAEHGVDPQVRRQAGLQRLLHLLRKA